MVRAKAQVGLAAGQCSARGSAAKAEFMASATARLSVYGSGQTQHQVQVQHQVQQPGQGSAPATRVSSAFLTRVSSAFLTQVENTARFG
jgi:hypothetical protein